MKKKYLKQRDINRYMFKMIQAMDKDEYRPHAIVGIGRGGLVPSVMMSQWFDAPHWSWDVSLKEKTLRDRKQPVNLDFIIDNVPFRNVLIVDDINDTGATFELISNNAAKEQNIKYAAVVNNLASNFNVDYCGSEINKIEKPEWIVFPWENWWE